MTNETAGTELVTVNPQTGEVIDLAAAPTDHLAQLTLDALDAVDRLHRFRDEVIAVLAERMDRELARTANVGDYKLSVNAPTRDEWDLQRLRTVLTELEQTGVLAPEVTARVIEQPPPKPQAERVKRTELNKLLKHPDEQVTAALLACKETAPQRRTLKVELA